MNYLYLSDSTQFMDKKKLVVSFSGGRTSAKMTHWILNEWEDRRNYEIMVVFANTGKERLETLDFIHKCDTYFGFNTVWIEAVITLETGVGTQSKVVTYETASRNGEPFEEVIKKFGIPNSTQVHCTRDLKIYPLKHYCRSIGWKKYYTAIGIRSDEPKRLDWDYARKNRYIYPLAEYIRTTKSDINQFWSKQPFDLELKSYEGNCDLCYKKGLRKLMTLVKDKPELADWWREMEEKYGYHTNPNRLHNASPPYRFFRDFMTVDDIIDESKFPFDPARDESKDIDKFKQMTMWDEYLDSNSGCTESCEVF